MALDGEHGVDGPWHDGCCGTSAGGPGARTWHFVVNWGCGADDGFRGGDPLQVVNHLDNLNWHGLWWQIEMGWRWLQRSKGSVAVAGIGPRVSRGVTGDWEAVQWLEAMVAIVAAAEAAPRIR